MLADAFASNVCEATGGNPYVYAARSAMFRVAPAAAEPAAKLTGLFRLNFVRYLIVSPREKLTEHDCLLPRYRVL